MLHEEDLPGKVITLCYCYQLFITIKLKEKLGVSQRKRKNKSIPGKDKKNIQKHKTAQYVLKYNSQNEGEAAETGS